MDDDVLVNPGADRVRQVRALVQRPVRERSGRFLVEGPQSVREAVRCSAGLHGLYLTEGSALRHPEIVAAARERGVALRLGTPQVLAAMSGDAQEVVAVAGLVDVPVGTALGRRPRLVVALVAVRDPGNAGTVLRAADAAGADAVVLTSACVDLHNPKVVRSAAGSLFHLPIATGVRPESLDEVLRARGLTVLAAAGDGAHDLDDLLDTAGHPGADPDLAGPTAWLFGNEAWGLPDEIRAVADATVRIPLHGRAESLNLATAAAVCLYASARAQRADARRSGPGPSGHGEDQP